MREWTRENLAWASGFFDGEGCLTLLRRKEGFHAKIAGGERKYWQPAYVYPSAYLVNTDVELLKRFGCLFPFGRITKTSKAATGNKPVFQWYVHGFEKTQALVAALWPWLSQRRRDRGIEVLTYRPIGRQEG